jgi:hypothetical protein
MQMEAAIISLGNIIALIRKELFFFFFFLQVFQKELQSCYLMHIRL